MLSLILLKCSFLLDCWFIYVLHYDNLVKLKTLFYVFVWSMAVGSPAKIIGYIEDEDPSFTMKHGIIYKSNYFHFLSKMFKPLSVPYSGDLYQTADAGKDYFEHVAIISTDKLNVSKCFSFVAFPLSAVNVGLEFFIFPVHTVYSYMSC